MSKKTLLSESQIRQFMKLAKLEPLTPGFVEGLTENTEELEERGMMRMRDEDDDLDEGRGMRRDEDEVEEGMRGMRRAEDEVDEMRMRGEDDEVDESHGRGRGEGAAGYGAPDQNTRLEEEEEDMAADAMDDAGDEMEMDAELEAPAEAPAADAGKMVSVDDFLSALERALEDAMGEEVEIDSDEVVDEEPADAMDAMDDEPEDADEMMEEGEHGDKEEVDEALMESITKRVAKRILMEALSTKK